MNMHTEIIHELSYEERATWGTCPICDAKHGEKCNGDFGIQLGSARPVDGVHLGRLIDAPNRVKTIKLD